MFWSKNKKKVYPCKPQFYYIKVGCKGVFVTRTCFRDGAGSTPLHTVDGSEGEAMATMMLVHDKSL